MSRPVSPWLWIVLAREFAPRNSSVRLVMHTLRSFMDRSGYTFPSQPLIAEAACLSLPTVRKALEIAWREKWVSVAFHFERGGQDWRSYEYRACVPDSLVVPEIHEKVFDAWLSEHEDVDTESHPYIGKLGKPVSHVKGKKLGKPVSHVIGENGANAPEGGKNGLASWENSRAKVGKLTSEGEQIDAPKVGKPLSPKSYSEKLSVSFQSKLSPEEAHALPRMCAVSGALNGKSSKAEKPEDAAAPSPEEIWNAQQEKIAKAIAAQPEWSDQEIATKMLAQSGITKEMVVAYRRSRKRSKHQEQQR